MFLVFEDHGMTFKDGQLVCFTIDLCSIFSCFSIMLPTIQVLNPYVAMTMIHDGDDEC